MRLAKARVQNYRSIIDTGYFDVEWLKTILVGPNEAGKTVLLQALQQLNKPEDINGFDPLRDYPRSKYNDITTGKVKPESVTVVTGFFELEEEDKALIPNEFHQCQYKVYRNLNNKGYHALINAPELLQYKDIKKPLMRMAAHMDQNYTEDNGEKKPSEILNDICSEWEEATAIKDDAITSLEKWLDDHYKYVEEDNETEEKRHSDLSEKIKINLRREEVLKVLDERTPVFVLFNNSTYINLTTEVYLKT